MRVSVRVILLFVPFVLGCTSTVVVDEEYNCGTSGCDPYGADPYVDTEDTESSSDTDTEMDTEAVRCGQLGEDECDSDSGCVSTLGVLFNDTDSCLEAPQFVWCMKLDAECNAETTVMLDPEENCWEFATPCVPPEPGWEVPAYFLTPPDCNHLQEFDDCL